MHAFLMTVLRNQRGAAAVEYGLIIALIFLAILSAVRSVTDETIELWEYVEERVTAELH